MPVPELQDGPHVGALVVLAERIGLFGTFRERPRIRLNVPDEGLKEGRIGESHGPAEEPADILDTVPIRDPVAQYSPQGVGIVVPTVAYRPGRSSG